MKELEIGYPFNNGFIDTISIEPDGIIQIFGWSNAEDFINLNRIRCIIDDNNLACIYAYKTYRPDVAQHLELDNMFCGFGQLYKITKKNDNSKLTIQIYVDNNLCFEHTTTLIINEPHYDFLINTPNVMHREHIYGSGPPLYKTNNEILEIVKTLNEPILDFGCGSGALVRDLRHLGLETFGIEINTNLSASFLISEIRKYVVLYDGNIPLPFSDNQFQSVTAIEVIEHIPNYLEIIKELTRICSNCLIISVPDSSSIPLCHKNNVVPWHLLEGTHVNFFNQNNLIKILDPLFKNISFTRISLNHTNSYKWWASVVAICCKQ